MEVKDVLNSWNNSVIPQDGFEIEAKEIISKALEKQIPMEIKEIHVDEYYCPSCGSENNCSNKIVEHKYCPECGQRLVSRTDF